MNETKANAGLQVKATETSPVLRTLAVTVDAARVTRAFERAYKELAKRAKVKGFRPGKAPRAVLERRYGAGLAAEVGERLVNETLFAAAAECAVTPVAEPVIEAPPAVSGADFCYSARLEVKPKIELPELTGLAAEKPRVAVTDAEVARELEALRERAAREEPVTGAGAAAAGGHILTVDYDGQVDGKPFEGGHAEGAKLELGAGRFIPGFEEQLFGAKPGELREVRVEFPADYAAPALRGKRAVFAVTLRAIARRAVPALDDDFARSLGDDAVKDVASLRATLTKRMRETREQAAKRALERSVVDALLARCKFEVPQGMVKARLAQRLEMAQRQFAQLMPREELERQLLALRDEWRPEAERDVRATLALAEVARAHELAPDDAELDAHIETLAREQGLAPERLREHARKEDLLPSLRAQRAEEKALAKLLEGAQVREVDAGEAREASEKRAGEKPARAKSGR